MSAERLGLGLEASGFRPIAEIRAGKMSEAFAPEEITLPGVIFLDKQTAATKMESQPEQEKTGAHAAPEVRDIVGGWEELASRDPRPVELAAQSGDLDARTAIRRVSDRYSKLNLAKHRMKKLR